MIEDGLYKEDCIRTFTGIYVNVFEPTIEMICIEDIAHALSNQCRFSGHLPEFYSVAQHCSEMTKIIDVEHKLDALLHDATEAYLMDIPTPIKRRLSNYKDIEDNLMKLIAQKFGLQYPFHEEIKRIDTYMLRWEWNKLMLNAPGQYYRELICLSPAEAKNQFLALFKLFSNVKN